MREEPALARLGRDRILQLSNANEALRRLEQTRAMELDTLQQIATQSITAHGMDPLYGRILDTVLTILHADLACIQSFYPNRGTNGALKLLGHRGFSADAAK